MFCSEISVRVNSNELVGRAQHTLRMHGPHPLKFWRSNNVKHSYCTREHGPWGGRLPKAATTGSRDGRQSCCGRCRAVSKCCRGRGSPGKPCHSAGSRMGCRSKEVRLHGCLEYGFVVLTPPPQSQDSLLSPCMLNGLKCFTDAPRTSPTTNPMMTMTATTVTTRTSGLARCCRFPIVRWLPLRCSPICVLQHTDL